MTHAHIHQPHHPIKDNPDEVEPGSPPVEPDEGPVPAVIPEDPEHERIIDPAQSRAQMCQRGRRDDELGG